MTKSTDLVPDIVLLPISSEQPAGNDIRYDDEFEFIEDELSKQSSMIDRGSINWEKLKQACVNILSNKSKDLKVACYLTRALFEKEGFPGLQAGLNINYQLLTIFWDDLFPQKIRARANAYEWLSDKFEVLFNDLKPDPDSLNSLQSSYKSIENIEQFLNEKLSDNAPAIGDFRRSVYELLETVKQLKINEEASTPEPKIINNSELNNNEFVQTDSISTQSGSSRINIDKTKKNLAHSDKNDLNKTLISAPVKITDSINEKDQNKIIRQCHETLRDLSSYSINKNLDAPSAYAMNRFSTWMGISTLPVHTENVTPLMPVPKDKIIHYTNLFNSKNYQELIPLVEQSFSKSPFWLDAHRLVSCSLDALGMYDASSQVKEYLAIFLRRFPDLTDLKFSDHSDFAAPSTKQWIHSEVLNDNLQQNNITSVINDDSCYEKTIVEAHDLAKQEKIKEAINLIQKNILIQTDMRKKTFWKYHLAQFCYDIAQHKLAFFLLKEIDGFLQKNNLRYWEPDLEKNVIYLLILCQKKGFKNSTDKTDMTVKNKEHNEIDKFYARLCQLDPILALDVI